jgi:hypothetical protein
MGERSCLVIKISIRLCVDRQSTKLVFFVTCLCLGIKFEFYIAPDSHHFYLLLVHVFLAMLAFYRCLCSIGSRRPEEEELPHIFRHCFCVSSCHSQRPINGSSINDFWKATINICCARSFTMKLFFYSSFLQIFNIFFISFVELFQILNYLNTGLD